MSADFSNVFSGTDEVSFPLHRIHLCEAGFSTNNLTDI